MLLVDGLRRVLVGVMGVGVMVRGRSDGHRGVLVEMVLLFVGKAAGSPEGGRRQVGVLQLVLLMVMQGVGARRRRAVTAGVAPFWQCGVARGRLVDHSGSDDAGSSSCSTFRLAARRR